MRVLGLNGWVALLSLVAIGVSSVALYRFSTLETGAAPEGDASTAAIVQPQERITETEQSSSSSVAPRGEPTGSLSVGHVTRTPAPSHWPNPPKTTVSDRDGEEVVNIGPYVPVDTSIGLKDSSSVEVINIGPYIPVDEVIGVTDDASGEVVTIGPDLPVPDA